MERRGVCFSVLTSKMCNHYRLPVSHKNGFSGICLFFSRQLTSVKLWHRHGGQLVISEEAEPPGTKMSKVSVDQKNTRFRLQFLVLLWVSRRQMLRQVKSHIFDVIVHVGKILWTYLSICIFQTLNPYFGTEGSLGEIIFQSGKTLIYHLLNFY